MKKIYIINGNPYPKSYCNELAKKYYEGAIESGFEVILINLYDLKFDPVLKAGYAEPMELEEDLKIQQENIKWCDHIVIISPVWWGATPALLKGFFDRVLLPNFAFKFTGPGKWDKLLTGKSARVIYTQGTPSWVSYFWDPFWNAINTGTLAFCGFKPVKKTLFGSIADSSVKQRKIWLNKVYTMGKKGI